MAFSNLILSTESIRSGVLIYWTGEHRTVLYTRVLLDIPSNIHGKTTLDVLLEGRNTGIRKDSPARFAGVTRYHEFLKVMYERAIRANMTLYFYHTPSFLRGEAPLVAIHGDGRLEFLEGNKYHFENLQQLMAAEGLKVRV